MGGIMGSGIGQVIAQNNMNVCIVDNNKNALALSQKNITQSFNKLLKRNKITLKEHINILNNNISWSNDLIKELQNKHIDIIIEAIPENFLLKENMINIVNNSNIENKDLIYASNTSSISITKMSSKFKSPHNFIGMHFMNPVPIMKLIEIIPGIQTSKNTIKKIQEFSITLQKITVVSKDYSGFIANRILIPMINEAFYALMEDLGTAKDIDNALKLGCNHPMGPLELADFIGLDTCLFVINILHKEFGDSKYRPCPLLNQYVSAGWLGRKSGRGVYKYDK